MNSKSKNRYRFAVAIGVSSFAALAVGNFGCATPQAMRSGDGVPGSEGTVEVKEGRGGNTDVAVRVKHLAPPARMAADANVYVVWIQARDAEKQSVGALTLNEDLEGYLDTLTPHRRFRLFVTPEASAQVGQPSHEPVFTADVDRRD